MYDDLYHVEPVDQPDWDGLRLLTSTDTVHTALHGNGMAARLYGEPGDWTVKTRIPCEDEGEAYETFAGIVDALSDRYDTGLAIDGFAFHEEADRGVTRSSDGFTLRYNPDDEHPAPTTRYTGLSSEGAFMGGMIGGGLVGVGESAVLGGSIDPGLGLLISFGSWAGITAGAVGANYALPRGVEKVQNWRNRRRYGSPDAIADMGLVEKLNRRNALEDYMREVTLETGLGEEYDALDDADLDATLQKLLEGHFERFHRQQGVTVTAEAGTYGEAVDMLETMAEERYREERPSVVRNPDAFQAMFAHTVFEDAVINQGEALVEQAVSGDADPAITDFLESRYPDLTRDVAARAALERGSG